MTSSNIIGIPTDPKAFEEKCIPLFAGLLKDPNVKLVGTQGKAQAGLDLIGRRDRDPNQPVGIQCKLVTRGGKLTEAIVRTEVDMALVVTPALTEYYIVTTATDDPTLDTLSITLSQEQAKLGRSIDIQVWGWDTLQQKIRADPAALNAFDPDYSASTNRLTALGAEMVDGQATLAAHGAQSAEGIEDIRSMLRVAMIDTARGAAFDVHLDAQVDDYRDLMNGGKPRTALGLLERLEKTLGPSNSAAIRARVRANIGFAHLKLGADAVGGRLLAEAFTINPSDPKVRANQILALALSGDLPAATAFGNTVMADDPANAGAAALLFQVATMAVQGDDPTDSIPPALLDDKIVRISRITYLRHKGAPGSWWALAAQTYADCPEDPAAVRMAGDALIDEGLAGGVMYRGTAFSPSQLDKIRAGTMLLQANWDEVRHYENAADMAWSMIGCNLLTGYRAIGNLEDASRVRSELLALGGNALEVRLAATQLAMDEDDDGEVVRLMHDQPESITRTMMLLAGWSRAENWVEILALATPERRVGLSDEEAQSFDVMRFRARRVIEPDFDLDAEVDRLIEAWPCGIGAHIVAADAYRKADPAKQAALSDKARSLFKADSAFVHRAMFAQLALFRGAWDDVITALDGYVAIDRDSEPLAWLALAFANASIRPRTRKFFAGLPAALISQSRYARLAGAAEHNRGDLVAAEGHLRNAIAADPTDLRAYLLLASTLERDNRVADAVDLLRGIDDQAAQGSAIDRMRLAHLHRRHGDIDRSLALGYAAAAGHRQAEDVLASYPGLILLEEALPDPIGRAGPIVEHFWFDLEGDGVADVNGVIDRQSIPGVPTFAPEHGFAAAVLGKSIGDTVVLPQEFGLDRRYTVRAIKHKYLWLLHDIMATHGTRFPEATSLIEVSMKDGDVQPVLDMVRDWDERGRFITQTYFDYPVPLAAIAAMTKKPVVAMAEHLPSIGANLRTCLGTHEERIAGMALVSASQGRGAVLDTLTFWFAHQARLLPALASFFGRLCIPRATFDELLEMRSEAQMNSGREYMTMGFDNGEAWRRVHTPADTEAALALMTAAIEAARQHCEIMAVDGSDDFKLDRAIGSFAAGKIADPLHIARSENLLLLSDDLNLRQFGQLFGVERSAWLQVVLRVALDQGALAETLYLEAVGMLAAMRHDHVWFDADTLVKLLTMTDFRAPAMFDAASDFIGGPKAEIISHVATILDFMARIWSTDLPHWRKGRAIGQLLTKLLRDRAEWKAILHILDHDLAVARRKSVPGSSAAHAYLVGWITGHFHDLAQIRSAQALLAERDERPRLKAPDKQRARRKRAFDGKRR